MHCETLKKNVFVKHFKHRLSNIIVIINGYECICCRMCSRSWNFCWLNKIAQVCKRL